MATVFELLGDSLPADQPVQESPGDFTRSLGRGLRDTGSQILSYGGGAADAMGYGELAQRARALAAEQQAAIKADAASDPNYVGSYKDVDGLKSGYNYVSGLLGGSVPQSAMAIGGSLLARTPVGRAVGATLATLPMEAGDIAQRQQADPQAMANTTPGERFMQQTLGGGVSAAAQSVLPAMIAGRIAAPARAGLRQTLRTGLRELPASVGIEGGTEGLGEAAKQAAVMQANPDRPWDTGALAESVIGGGVAGGAMHGVGVAGESAHALAAAPGNTLASVKDTIKGAADTAAGLLRRKGQDGGTAPAGEGPAGEGGGPGGGFNFGSPAETLKNAVERAMQAGGDFWDKVRNREEIADASKLVGLAGDAIRARLPEIDAERMQRVKDGAVEMLNDAGLDPALRARITEASTDLANKANQAIVAGAKKAWDAAKEVGKLAVEARQVFKTENAKTPPAGSPSDHIAEAKAKMDAHKAVVTDAHRAQAEAKLSDALRERFKDDPDGLKAMIENRAQGLANREKAATKKSADYSGLEKAIWESVVPVIGKNRPDLIATEQGRRDTAEALRLMVTRMAENPHDEQAEGMLAHFHDVFGNITQELFRATYKAVYRSGTQATEEAFWGNFERGMDHVAKTTAVTKLIQENLKPEYQRQQQEGNQGGGMGELDMQRAATAMLHWVRDHSARTKARMSNTAPAESARQRVEDRETIEGLRQMFGDKLQRVLDGVEKLVKAADTRLEKERAQLDEEGNDVSVQGEGGEPGDFAAILRKKSEEDMRTNGAREGKEEREGKRAPMTVYTPKDSPDGLNLYMDPKLEREHNAKHAPERAPEHDRTAQAIERARKAHPDRTVSFVNARELTAEQMGYKPKSKAGEELDVHPALDTARKLLADRIFTEQEGISAEEALALAHKEILSGKYGIVAAEGENSPGTLHRGNIREVQPRKDKEGKTMSADLKQPSVFKAGGVVYDARRLVQWVAKEFDREPEFDNVRGLARTKAQFLAGVAALQDYLGKTFEVPDSVEVDQKGTTFGDLKKLDTRTEEDKATDAQRGKLEELRTAWARAKKDGNATRMERLEDEAKRLIGDMEFKKAAALIGDDPTRSKPAFDKNGNLTSEGARLVMEGDTHGGIEVGSTPTGVEGEHGPDRRVRHTDVDEESTVYTSQAVTRSYLKDRGQEREQVVDPNRARRLNEVRAEYGELSRKINDGTATAGERVRATALRKEGEALAKLERSDSGMGTGQRQVDPFGNIHMAARGTGEARARKDPNVLGGVRVENIGAEPEGVNVNLDGSGRRTVGENERLKPLELQALRKKFQAVQKSESTSAGAKNAARKGEELLDNIHLLNKSAHRALMQMLAKGDPENLAKLAPSGMASTVNALYEKYSDRFGKPAEGKGKAKAAPSTADIDKSFNSESHPEFGTKAQVDDYLVRAQERYLQLASQPSLSLNELATLGAMERIFGVGSKADLASFYDGVNGSGKITDAHVRAMLENAVPEVTVSGPKGVKYSLEKTGARDESVSRSAEKKHAFIGRIQRHEAVFADRLRADGYTTETRAHAFPNAGDFGPVAGAAGYVTIERDGTVHAFAIDPHFLTELQTVFEYLETKKADEQRYLDALSYYSIQHAHIEPDGTFGTVGPSSDSPVFRRYEASMRATGQLAHDNEPYYQVNGVTRDQMARFFGMLSAFNKRNGGSGDLHWTRETGAKVGKEGSSKVSGENLGATGTVTPQQQADIRTHIDKVLGPQVEARISQRIQHAGDFTPGSARVSGKDLIRISALALNPMGVAYHESLHGLFSQLMQQGNGEVAETLMRVAHSERILNELKAKFKDHAGVLAQLTDPEEAAAYMYQLWAQGQLEVRGRPRTIFGRIANWIRTALGIWSADERAEKILEYFHSGEFAKNSANPTAVSAALVDAGKNKAIEALKDIGKPLNELREALMVAGGQRLRNTGIAALREIADLMKATGRIENATTTDPGFITAARHERARVLNSMAQKFAAYDEADLKEALEAMQSGAQATGANAKAIQAEVQDVLLPKMLKYMQDAGVKVTAIHPKRALGDKYFPRVYDPAYLESHRAQFKAVLDQHQIFNGDAIVDSITNAHGQEFTAIVDRPGFQPGKDRKLWMIPDRELAPFMKKDLYGILDSYVTQATRRAEWARRFDDDGKKLADLFAEARDQGATKEQLEVARKYVRAVDGTLGDDLNPMARHIMGNVLVYQNLRLLPFAVFSSVVDPLGIMVRGGTIKDAFHAWKLAGKAIIGTFNDAYGRDAERTLAETLGTIDADVLSELYTQGMVGDTARKVNDLFFKYNFMEGVNRSMRIAATTAAIKFLERHAAGTASPHSKRWLAELGLAPGVVVDLKDPKIQAAINMWVDGAVLRPDAADKPIWMSDPHFMLISHLKQFAHSFNETILKRVAHEYRNGNVTPALVLASYVPIMIASDMLKDVIAGGGDVPEWKRTWGAGDYVWHGVERAGILGTSQYLADGPGMAVGPTLQQLTGIVSAGSYPKSKGSVFVDALPAHAVLEAGANALN